VFKAILTLSLLAPMMAMADTAGDLARIRPLLPTGTDVAQLQAALLQGSSEADAEKLASENYLLRDINGDGLEDLLVIAEVNPSLENRQTNQPCAPLDEFNCKIVYGQRSLLFFLGQRDGSLKLEFANSKMVLNGDEGGAIGDPLSGFMVRKNGGIALLACGGSAWRWSYTDVMDFRNGDLYVVGQDSYVGWTGDLRSDTKSIDLITGQVVETHQKNGNSPIQTKRYNVAVKPLVRVADYQGQSPN